LLDVETKKQVVLHEGILVAKRHQYQHMVFLFQMEGYYVETYCNKGNKAIDEFRVFDNTQTLLPYLDTIRIDQLLN
jgi:hypothetical protein